MSKRIYISADYAPDSGDRNVVETLNNWGTDSLHKVDFVDMAKVVSGTIAKDPDCKPCDLKSEFNRQINASSVVICIIGDKTATRTAGSGCSRGENQFYLACPCTPYKQNRNGVSFCKVKTTCSSGSDLGSINKYSFLRHEFEQAKKRNKVIVVMYNSLIKQTGWLPSYMREYKEVAEPFWKRDDYGNKVGNYALIKKLLGYV